MKHRAQLMENMARRRQREEVYRRYGYDVERALDFVMSAAEPLTGRVLEVGTGKGRLLSRLAQQAEEVVTVDIDAGEQRMARLALELEGTAHRVRFVTADAAHLPFGEAEFDVVISMNTLHHLADWRAVLREMIRVSAPGGRIVLADFDEEGFRIFDRIHRDEGRVHGRVFYDPEEVARFLAQEGGMQVGRRQGPAQWVMVGWKASPAVVPPSGRGWQRSVSRGLFHGSQDE